MCYLCPRTFFPIPGPNTNHGGEEINKEPHYAPLNKMISFIRKKTLKMGGFRSLGTGDLKAQVTPPLLPGSGLRKANDP
jgi:hypothetical protein